MTIALSSGAQVLLDKHGEPAGGMAFYKNQGQIIDTDGNLHPEIFFSSFNAYPKVYASSWNTVSMVLGTPDTIINTLDTIYRVDMTHVGEGIRNVEPVAYEGTQGVHNYYYAHTPNGVEGVQGNKRVVYHDIYDGIDLHLYSNHLGMKLYYVFNPGSNPSDLQIQFAGHDSLVIDIWGDLKVYLKQKFIKLPEAEAYQDNNGVVQNVSWGANYQQLNGVDQIGFYFGTYNPNLPLILQIGVYQAAPPPPPNGNLNWSTHIGENVFGFDGMTGLDTDKDGNVFYCGQTNDIGFPAVAGQNVIFYQDLVDMIIGRFEYAPGDPNTDAENTWTTFYGGTFWDIAYAVHLNDFAGTDRLFVCGSTNSTDILPFPFSDPNDGTYWQDVNNGSNDGLILRFDELSGLLARATYFGGPGNDIPYAMTSDGSGNLFISGTTSSALAGNSTDCTAPPNGGFPLCDIPGPNDHFDNTLGGSTDAFIARFNNNELTWSTYFGGAGDENVQDIDHMADNFTTVNDIVIVGGSNGTVPQNSIGANPFLQIAPLNGSSTGFIAQFGTDGIIKWSTNIRNLHDLQAVAASKDRIIVTGVTAGVINPVLDCNPQNNGIPICDPPGGNEFVNASGTYNDIYIAEFHPETNELYWSTLYGEGTDETAELARDAIGGWYHGHYMELELDENGVLYLMGAAAMDDPLNTFPTVNYNSFYHRAYDNLVGYFQSDVVLMCFPSDRSLIWTALFGGLIPTTGDPNLDALNIEFGSEIGRAMSLADETALYIGGITLDINIPLECPFPNGDSYCEDVSQPIGSSDMFISRFKIQGLNVGIEDSEVNISSNSMIIAPLSQDAILITLSDPTLTLDIEIYNVLGALVWEGRISGSRRISTIDWGAGVYAARGLGSGSLNIHRSKKFLVR